MRKYVILGLCFFMVPYCASPANGTVLSVGVNGGYAFPDVYMQWGVNLEPGPGGGVKLQITPWRYGEIELNGGYYKTPGTPTPAVSSLVPLKAGVNFKTGSGRYTIRFGGGAGYYLIKATAYGNVIVGVYEGEEEWDYTWGKVNLSGPGLYCGGGIAVNFGRWSLDFTPRWNYISNEGVHEGIGVGQYSGRRLYFGLSQDFTYAEAALGVSYRVF